MNSSTRTQPFIVGLTGGIGSGKSTVCEIFQQLGVEIIDADIIAREVVMPGSAALSTIARHFGQDIIAKDGSLDRSALRDIIFNDEKERNWLENLLHPMIRQRIQELISKSSSSYVILCAPLLLESGHYDFIDRVLVVDVSPANQIRRS